MIVRKSLLCLSIYVLSSLHHISASANGPASGSSVSPTHASSEADVYINTLYQAIDFGKGDKLDPEVFNKAMRGFLNLKNAGKLQGRDILTIADFSKSSSENRLWIIDISHNKVLYNTYVAHGQGSGNEFATAFSNQNESHQSSLGFYVTGDTYVGHHGTSLRLNGMDNGYNSAALERGIVVHAADYVSKETVASQQRLGRSWGCPAVNPELAPGIINTIKNGTCLFIYYPQTQYLKSSYWVNKTIEHIPGANQQHNMEQQLEPSPTRQLASVIRMDDSAATANMSYRIPTQQF